MHIKHEYAILWQRYHIPYTDLKQNQIHMYVYGYMSKNTTHSLDIFLLKLCISECFIMHHSIISGKRFCSCVRVSTNRFVCALRVAGDQILCFLAKFCSPKTIKKEIDCIVHKENLVGYVVEHDVHGVKFGVVLVCDEVESKVA